MRPRGFVPFILVAQALLVVVYFTVGETAAAAFGAGAWLPWLSVALSFTFLAASLTAHRHASALIDWFYRTSAYMLGLAFFLLGGAFLYFIIITSSYAAGSYPPPPLVGAVCFGALFLLHLYGTWHSAQRAVTRISVALPGLPPAWRGKTVVFLSDLHLGNVRGRRTAAKVAEAVRALHPEALFIGGDLYDGGSCDGSGVIEPFRAAVAELPRGAYFVAGNHEYFLADAQHAFAAIRALGVRILDNELADLGGLRVAGVDYHAARRRDDFAGILKKIGVRSGEAARGPVILLKHEPADVDVARDAGVAFSLFGHTHNGQIWPLSILAQKLYKGFSYGLRTSGAMRTYTSSGAGTWGPPLRLWTRSEIVHITFE